MPLTYPELRIIWWLLLGILIIGFAVMDGFDIGAAMLLPLVARTDLERRITINTVGPVWEGNQVWFILGGGAIFAAWPSLYAVSFSSFYLAMLLLLFCFIIRPVAFKYRSKMPALRWRYTWDYLLAVSALLTAVVFGVAIGNVLQGIPFHFDQDLRAFYTGNFFELFNTFALLCGLLSAFMLAMHGGLYVAVKTTDRIHQRAYTISRSCALLVIILFAIGGIWIAKGIQGYQVSNAIDFAEPSNPLYKTVTQSVGAWLNNYHQYPYFMLAPALGFFGAIIVLLFAKFSRFAFLSSGISILGIILTVGFSMFPFLLPSTTNPNMSLIVWDASSSQSTLFIMLVATLILLPIVLMYTSWVYYVLRGKVTANDITSDEHGVY
ncbi:MAG: cytochrome d ubiquinol oxidase subunit II [Legionellales bacterium]|nr:cytochrome d ubiquinol oxidase subunit II [Legionellales bacterium]